MNVGDLMTTDVVTTSPTTLLKAAARELAARGVSGLPVVDAGGNVVGVLSEADVLAKEVDGGPGDRNLLRRLLEGPLLDDRYDAVTVGDAMSAPAIVIHPDDPVTDAATRMLAEGINRLPVVSRENGASLVGIVTRADLVRAFTRDDATIKTEIERCILEDLWIEPTRVTVYVSDGRVTLSGELETDADARAIAAMARRLPGVVDVTSTLHARP